MSEPDAETNETTNSSFTSKAKSNLNRYIKNMNKTTPSKRKAESSENEDAASPKSTSNILNESLRADFFDNEFINADGNLRKASPSNFCEIETMIDYLF